MLAYSIGNRMKHGVKRKQPEVNEVEEPGAKKRRNTKALANYQLQHAQTEEAYVPTTSNPQLPPEVRETDRMLAVQRWINNIPRDGKSWIQISFDRVVSIDNPLDFPFNQHTRQDCPFQDCYECHELDQRKLLSSQQHQHQSSLHMAMTSSTSAVGGNANSYANNASQTLHRCCAKPNTLGGTICCLPGMIQQNSNGNNGQPQDIVPMVVDLTAQSLTDEVASGTLQQGHPANKNPNRMSPTIHHFAGAAAACNNDANALANGRQPLKIYSTTSMGVVNRIHHIDPWTGATVDSGGRQLAAKAGNNLHSFAASNGHPHHHVTALHNSYGSNQHSSSHQQQQQQQQQFLRMHPPQQPPPSQQQQAATVSNNFANPNTKRKTMDDEDGDNLDDSTSSRRLYSEKEINMIVNCFLDFFQKGDVPTLKEVRERLTRTSLEATRGASSIRAKVKRLQLTGRWVDYNNHVASANNTSFGCC